VRLGKGRPSPIVLTPKASLISLQRELKRVVSGEIIIRNTETGTWITTKSMADYTIQKFFTEKNLHFFTFYKKTDKPVKSYNQAFACQHFYREHHCAPLPGYRL
jgi:hypothetical protein